MPTMMMIDDDDNDDADADDDDDGDDPHLSSTPPTPPIVKISTSDAPLVRKSRAWPRSYRSATRLYRVSWKKRIF